jgi:hypothetical protein
MGIIHSITKIFTWGKPLTYEFLDPTQYRITTNTNEYLGIIIYQDAFLIKFQSQKNKMVKILKSEINQMSVVLPIAHVKSIPKSKFRKNH